MSGAAKGFQKIGGSTIKLATGKGNFRDTLRVNPFTGGFMWAAEAAGMNTDKALSRGGGYTPQQLPSEDPKLLLAQSGGAPLLTQIALGADVEDALAGYFGRRKGDDWDVYQANLKPDEQAAIDGVRNQLKSIQSNTNLRNQAVQKIVEDYPNVVSQIAPRVQQAKAEAGQEFDDTSKQYLDYALRQVGAKYAAGGQLSSGAMVQAGADAGAKLGLDKLNYVTGRGDVAYGKASNELLGDWQNRYNEANALRSFQQTMLGQGVQQGFSANQAYLNRKQSGQQFNAGLRQQMDITNQQSQDAMMGALGGLAGTAVGAYFGGPLGAAVGGKAGSSLMQGNSFPQGSSSMNSPVAYQNPSLYGSGNPRLNLPRY